MRFGARQSKCVLGGGDFTEVTLILVCSLVYVGSCNSAPLQASHSVTLRIRHILPNGRHALRRLTLVQLLLRTVNKEGSLGFDGSLYLAVATGRTRCSSVSCSSVFL